VLSAISNWATTAYTNWSTGTKSGRNFAGFLADPVGSLAARGLDYAKGRATDYIKSKIEDKFNLQEKTGTTGLPQMQMTSAARAQSGAAEYNTFNSKLAQAPGMRVEKIRNAFDRLYNVPELKVPNVQLTVDYTRPNIAMASPTITPGSSTVSRQLVKSTAKSALSRVS